MNFMGEGTLWVLVLLCQCAQPPQALFETREVCEFRGRHELYAVSTSVYASPKFRCVEIPR